MLYFSFASISFIGPCSLGVAKMVTPTTYGISGMVSMLVSLLKVYVLGWGDVSWGLNHISWTKVMITQTAMKKLMEPLTIWVEFIEWLIYNGLKIRIKLYNYFEIENAHQHEETERKAHHRQRNPRLNERNQTNTHRRQNITRKGKHHLWLSIYSIDVQQGHL